jgi:UDPglucose--hexose-1-phosphate uridylyltransferase
MSEFRQNPVTREWVVIATDRSKRPHELQRPKEGRVLPERVETCPFCPGNESLTPPEVLSYRHNGSLPNTPGWWTRVIPNKFPALQPIGSLERTVKDSIFRRMEGVGRHEVVIDTPKHNEIIPFMTDRQVEELLFICRQRYLDLHEDPNHQIIVIFKNYGPGAGTSIEHPHCQILATPVVPAHIRNAIDQARQYFDDQGSCVFCDLTESELKSGERVVSEGNGFVAIHPFASIFPFETWILPKGHDASFSHITLDEAKALGRTLKQVLLGLYRGLNDPDFNFIIHTAPCKDESEGYFHWHVQILPRLTIPAGFEFGSGMAINTVRPEESADFMRQTLASFQEGEKAP